jgi:uncharacterized protein (TIGR02118 family)
VAKLIILYGQPADPAAFEDYYASRHIPYASKHMPGVRGAKNMRVLSTPEGGPPPYYRVSQLSYDSVEDALAGIASEDPRH